MLMPGIRDHGLEIKLLSHDSTSVFGKAGTWLDAWQAGLLAVVSRAAMFFTNFQAMKAPKETTEPSTDKFH
jgi:hypothetical protein